MMASDIGEELEATEETRAVVERQLRRILAHSSFRNSRRCQAFLRYVVDEKLNGNADHLKERMIGVAVFQQPLDYDTNANSVVRVTAGDVRRRLAQYYIEANAGDELLIELPLGSYVPEFRPIEAAAKGLLAARPTAFPLCRRASNRLPRHCNPQTHLPLDRIARSHPRFVRRGFQTHSQSARRPNSLHYHFRPIATNSRWQFTDKKTQ